MASTLLSTTCGAPTTFLFCLSSAKRVSPIPAGIPATSLATNTFAAAKGGATANNVPLPKTAALGDRIAVLYQGGNVVVMADAVAVYTFDPVGDLNKVVSFVFDGVKWGLE